MNKIILSSESTCDFSSELIEKHQIKIMPLIVHFQDENYYDGIDITTPKLFDLVEKKNTLPKTAARNSIDYYNFFKEEIDKGNDIVHISLSSEFSSSYQNAFLAKQDLEELGEHVYLIDGRNLSTGTGLLLLKAAKFRDQGLSAKQIEEKIKDFIPRVKSQFVIETLEYLHKGGRCSTTALLFGSVLRIKPMILVRNGKMAVGKKSFGSIKKAINKMIKMFITDLPNVDKDFVFVTHSEGDSNAKFIFEQFKQYPALAEIKNIFETRAGCVISSHCGKGTIGILYIMNDKVELEQIDNDSED